MLYSRTETVDAMAFDGTNGNEVQDWANGTVSHCYGNGEAEPFLQVYTPLTDKWDREARKGSVLVRLPEYGIYVYSQEVFDGMGYTPVEATPEAPVVAPAPEDEHEAVTPAGNEAP